MKYKQTILIVDDYELNRVVLSNFMEQEYDVIEASNGIEALEIIKKTNVDLILLDMVMPEMNGIEVLEQMNQDHSIETIPVIMISSENDFSYIDKVYDLGVSDYITRPFNYKVVLKKVKNTIMLYHKQKNLVNIIYDQLIEKEKESNLMIAILSHIVEFRNGESGLHIIHIKRITRIILEKLKLLPGNPFALDYHQIALIAKASALHDIGKISIPDEIINKPGKLTKEEFEIMKTHTTKGAEILDHLPLSEDEELVHLAHNICLYHHERWDGNGYPCHLKGNQIPLASQVVALADCYDALTSIRVYKRAYTHEEALKMIKNKECGEFNPLIIEVFLKNAEEIKNNLMPHGENNIVDTYEYDFLKLELSSFSSINNLHHSLSQIEIEKNKYDFYLSLTNDILFDYNLASNELHFSGGNNSKLKYQEQSVINPRNDEKLSKVIASEDLNQLFLLMNQSTYENPTFIYECKIKYNGIFNWVKFICQSVWSVESYPKMTGVIGKVVDINEEKMTLLDYKYKAHHDHLTKLYNRAYGIESINKLLKNTNLQYVFAFIDFDNFKIANDSYGHEFGDIVLKKFADKMIETLEENQVCARIGGDEFIYFFPLSQDDDLDQIMNKFIQKIIFTIHDFTISFSIGLSLTTPTNRDFNILLKQADFAMYQAKAKNLVYFVYQEEK